MFLFIIGILLCILAGILIYKYNDKLNHLTQEDEEIKRRNEITKQENQKLETQQEGLKQLAAAMKEKLQEQQESINNANEVSQKAYEQYCDILEENYQKTDEEYTNLLQTLADNYEKMQDELITAAALKKDELNNQIWDLRADLNKISNTRAAALEAIRKEKEIKANKSDYCVIPTQDELDDIQVLERIKPKLNQSRILCMLIWSTYYQKRMTKLCNDLLGTSIVCGIYKITNQLDNMCYIGQSVNVAERWKQHAKCGLGIDTPVQNKLYQAMLEDGLYNFSFELLEECPREELNEKEAFYIQSYQADKYGYNSTSGNK